MDWFDKLVIIVTIGFIAGMAIRINRTLEAINKKIDKVADKLKD